MVIYMILHFVKLIQSFQSKQSQELSQLLTYVQESLILIML